MAGLRSVSAIAVLGLSKAINLHSVSSNASSSEDKCACLKWQDAYSGRYGETSCGSGRELAFIHGHPGELVALHPQFAFEFCMQFWKAMPNDDICVKSEFGSREADDNWCYVSPECKPMLGNVKLDTKTCVKGTDKILGDMKFEEFCAYMDEKHLEKGLAVQYGYPVFSEKLPDVLEFWGLQLPGAQGKPMTDELRQTLQKHVDSGKTMFIPSVSGHPPFAVSEGKKLYWINFSEANKKRQAAREDVWAHKEEMNAWACVAGCDENKPIF